jgi:hypothetical protein
LTGLRHSSRSPSMFFALPKGVQQRFTMFTRRTRSVTIFIKSRISILTRSPSSRLYLRGTSPFPVCQQHQVRLPVIPIPVSLSVQSLALSSHRTLAAVPIRKIVPYKPRRPRPVRPGPRWRFVLHSPLPSHNVSRLVAQKLSFATIRLAILWRMLYDAGTRPPTQGTLRRTLIRAITSLSSKGSARRPRRSRSCCS